MTTARLARPDVPPESTLRSALDSACRLAAPSWPLDRQIAVNPWWGWVGKPFGEAAAELHRLAGAALTLPAAEYLRAWERGDISPAAITRASLERGTGWTMAAAVAALRAVPGSAAERRLLSELIDAGEDRRTRPRWRETITQQISQYCASYFDQHQADWRPGSRPGLFAGWRRDLQADHALDFLMHAPQIRGRSRDLPDNADAALAWAVARLGLTADENAELLQACLLRIPGWASWCAYLGWEAALAGASDPNLAELLVIRVCWEALLHEDRGDTAGAGAAWRAHWRAARETPTPAVVSALLTWQRAYEISYQNRLVAQLTADRPTPVDDQRPARPAVQAVFCIDVRSERLRRAVELTDPAVETRGFAGFFGLPVRYAPLGTRDWRPQLPGLLAPRFEVTETTGDERLDHDLGRRRRRARRRTQCAQPLRRLPTGSFALVETLGLGYLGSLLGRQLGLPAATIPMPGRERRAAHSLRPVLRIDAPRATEQQADLVASILRLMGLTRGFARLVVLVGHGSRTTNNPQAAALHCGACGGQTGEVNARVLAGLLNDPAIREALASRGIDLPADTLAVAALHDTTTDEVTLFDAERLPASHDADVASIRQRFLEAGRQVRAERAPALGLARLASQPTRLLRRLRRRASDWAEVRPEWGLAGNAALIIAPRARTRGLDLGGRCFLHDYDAESDYDGSVLELIMTAPLVVAHWINLQYYAAVVDPERFGSGNKVLHNVVGGRIGVFEGNTGDLRTGLSRQSVHDGERWMHEPLRLTAVIDAPRERIDGILARHQTVRQLVDHEWLYLLRFTDRAVEQRRRGLWLAWPAAGGGR